MFETNKEKILRKIKALLDRTESAGFTVEEAAEAMRKASELMTRYNIARSDITQDQIKFTEVEKVWGKRHQRRKATIPYSRFCLMEIEALTDTVLYYRAYEGTLICAGEEHNIKFALYLEETIRNGVDRAYDQYRLSNKGQMGKGRGAASNFKKAMLYEIVKKLRELIASRNSYLKQQNALVPVTIQSQILQSLGVKTKIHTKTSDMNVTDKRASNAGIEAGKGFNVNRPLESNQNPIRQLGGK